MQKLKKEEFVGRISKHLAHRQNSEAVNLIWKGYLAALMEWGFFEPNDYHDLNAMLTEAGNAELQELFIGYPGQYE